MTIAHLPRTLVIAAALVGLVAGCGLGPDAQEAAATAQDFQDAVAAQDGARACALLAPDTASEVADQTGEPCEQAVLDAAPPPSGSGAGSPDARVYGRQAQVRLDGDVLFLAVTAGHWAVTAAGCTPRTDRPYDCSVEGS